MSDPWLIEAKGEQYDPWLDAATPAAEPQGNKSAQTSVMEKPARLDPNEAYKQAGETWDTAQALNVPISTVDKYSSLLGSLPQPQTDEDIYTQLDLMGESLPTPEFRAWRLQKQFGVRMFGEIGEKKAYVPEGVNKSVGQMTPELTLWLKNKFPMKKIGERLTPEQFTQWRNEKHEFIAGEKGLRKILSEINKEEEDQAQFFAADPLFLMARRAEPSFRGLIYGLAGKFRDWGKSTREWLYGPEISPQVLARVDQIVAEVEAKYPMPTWDKILFATPAIAIDVGNIVLEFGIAGVFLEFLGVGGVGAQVVKHGFKASLLRHVPSAALLFGTRRFIEGVVQKEESVGEATVRSLPEVGVGAVFGAAGATIETFSPPVIQWLSNIKDSNSVRYHMMMYKALTKLGKTEVGKEHFYRAFDVFRARNPQQAANFYKELTLLRKEAKTGMFIKRPANLNNHAKLETAAIVRYELAGKGPAEAQKLAQEAAKATTQAGKVTASAGNLATKAAPKQPWEMTKAEVREVGKTGQMKDLPWMTEEQAERLSREEFDKVGFKGLGDPQKRADRLSDVAEAAHKEVVQQALSEGKPVPAEVLAEYPELKPAAEGKVATKAPTIGQPGFVDLTPIYKAGELAQKAATGLGKKVDKAGRVFTRFKGLESDVRKTLIGVEEEQRLIPERAAKITVGEYSDLTDEESLQIQEHLDNPKKYPNLPEKFQPFADAVTIENKQTRAILNEFGYEADWPNGRIKALEERLDLAETPEVKQEIADAIADLQGLGYTHRVYAPESLMKKVRKWGSSKKISKRPSGLLGRKILTLDDAIEQGLKPQHLAIAQADLIAIAQKAQLHNSLVEAINSNPNLALPEKIAPEEWEFIDPRLMPAAKGNKYHPDIAEAIRELTWTSDPFVLTRLYDNFNSTLKHLMFYNPPVMGKNDIFQAWRATGLGFVGKLPKAFMARVRKSPEYQTLRKMGLYNNVIDLEPSAKALAEDLLNQIRKGWGVRAAKHMARYINPHNILKDFYTVNSWLTWNMDEVLRTATAMSLMEGGPITNTLHNIAPKIFPKSFQDRNKLTDFETVELANDFMANYAKVPKRSRKWFNRGIFTPTYRISMARVLGKMMKNPVKFGPQIARHLAYKGFLRFVLPGLVGMWVVGKWQAGRLEKGYRVAVLDPDTGKEIVFSLSDPLLEENKIMGRTIAQTLEYNLAAVPTLLLNLIRPSFRKQLTTDKTGHLFKLGTPVIRDLVQWQKEDRTTTQKFLTQLAIAYVYTRKPKPTTRDKNIARNATLAAFAIYIDLKMRFGEIDRNLGTQLKAKILTAEEARAEEWDNTYHKPYQRPDGQIMLPGEPHKGKEDYVKALRNRLKKIKGKKK